MTLILDAGAFVALERGDRDMWARLTGRAHGHSLPKTHGAVLAQVWRGGGGRQALLSRALTGVEVVPVGEQLGKAAGVLQRAAASDDAIDAALVALAEADDVILTSDAVDIQRLVDAARIPVSVVRV